MRRKMLQVILLLSLAISFSQGQEEGNGAEDTTFAPLIFGSEEDFAGEPSNSLFQENGDDEEEAEGVNISSLISSSEERSSSEKRLEQRSPATWFVRWQQRQLQRLIQRNQQRIFQGIQQRNFQRNQQRIFQMMQRRRNRLFG